jgi:glutamyl-tRNA synthetase
MEISDEKIEAYALENAVKHGGKAQAGNVLSSLFAEGLQKSEIKDVMPRINEAVSRINGMPVGVQKEKYDSVKKDLKKREVRAEGELPELPNAEMGKVVMRVAPFPSGPLHIGNARPVILNGEYAKKYNGKLFLVIDDTIGSEEKPIEPEAYKLIPEGIEWLGINYEKEIIYKSDRLETYYAYAEEMIKKGYMYVCSCSPEDMRENREKGVECACREYPGDKQLERWKKMFAAKEGEFTVRLKTSMQHQNPAFRDRVMFRVSERRHAKVGNKYRVWPLMDFSQAIDDHLLGMTHIIRGVELLMETEVEKFIWDIFKWKYPETIHTGLFKIEGVKLSKSKGAKEVKSGQYTGWNDPRLWSLQSLRDRGIQPQAIRDFIISAGLSKANTAVSVDALYAINKKYIEDSPRYFFVEDPVKIHIKGCLELTAKLPLHPSKEFGFREYKTSQDFLVSKIDFELLEDKNYRLMHLLNFKSEKIGIRPREFSFISVEPDEKLKVKFIHWLSASQPNMKTTILMPDGSVIAGLSEPNIGKLKPGQIIQFERFGFCRVYKQNRDSVEIWFAHR